MEQVTVSYGPEHAGATVRLYTSLVSGSPAEMPFTALNAEKWDLRTDGFALVGENKLDNTGKITFRWVESEHAEGRLQAAVNLVGGWRLSTALSYGQPSPPEPPPPAEEEEMIMRTARAVPRRRVTAYAASRFAEPARLAVEAV